MNRATRICVYICSSSYYMATWAQSKSSTKITESEEVHSSKLSAIRNWLRPVQNFVVNVFISRSISPCLVFRLKSIWSWWFCQCWSWPVWLSQPLSWTKRTSQSLMWPKASIVHYTFLMDIKIRSKAVWVISVLVVIMPGPVYVPQKTW